MAEKIGTVTTIADIPVDTVAEKLRQTMVMGMPTAVADRPTFYFDPAVTWDKSDREGSPFEWTDVPASETDTDPVQVVCAWEFFSPLGRQGAFITEVGEFNPTTVVFTMFEAEFTLVTGASYVTMGPDAKKWWFRFWRPVSALNTMNVYEAHFVADGGA